MRLTLARSNVSPLSRMKSSANEHYPRKSSHDISSARTMRAWREFEDATGHKVSKLDSDDVTRMPELLYYFVREGCKNRA